MSMSMPDDPLLTPSQAAKRIGVCPRDAFVPAGAFMAWPRANRPLPYRPAKPKPPGNQASDDVLWSVIPYEGWPKRLADCLYQLGVRRWRDMAALGYPETILKELNVTKRAWRYALRRMEERGVRFDPTLPRPTRVLHPFGASACPGVYFLRCHEFIKIGSAGNIRKRVEDIAQVTPWEIDVLGFIKRPDRQAAFVLERELHKQFASYRVRGEWFQDCVEIRAFIAEHQRSAA